MHRLDTRQAIVGAVAVLTLCLGLYVSPRVAANTARGILHVYNAIDEKLFVFDMLRYEARCDKYYGIYHSQDAETAKQALRQIIALSLAERQNATRYWRFNHLISLSYARLAVIEEFQGKRPEADRLFALASAYRVLQARAWNRDRGFKEESEEKPTSDQLRHFVTALDRTPKWSEPNQPPTPAP